MAAGLATPPTPSASKPAAVGPRAERAKSAKRKAAAELTVEAIRAGFTGPIPPVRPTLTYRLGLLVATAMMLLVPLVYLALIGLFGYAVYYHAVNHTEILTAVSGRGAVLAFAVYVAPMVIGPILLLFMLKPFFSRAASVDRSRSLVRENEPLLFAFVDEICGAVNSPRPRRIDVDCQLNASAGFRRGLRSFFGGDLVLTIGMPLVAGLTAREFGGVLAHEFGHFSQGLGMRLTYVLRSLSAWLLRVVYERDEWDQWLAGTAGQIDLRLGWILWLAILMVWVTRRVLWVLVNASMAVVGFVLRQMEYDADRYGARLAGSADFESTTRKMARLGAASEQAYRQLAGSHQEGKLVDDLPRLVLLNLTRLPGSVDAELKRRLETHRTGWFDSHPADRDRIANAHREDAPGVLTLAGPAGRLFADFDAQCKAATWEFYRQAIHGPVDRKSLQSVADLHASAEERDDAYEAMNRYTQATLRQERRLGLTRDCLTPPENPRAAADELRRLRERFDTSIEAWREKLQRRDSQLVQLLSARVFSELHRAGVRLRKKDLAPHLATRDGAAASRKRAQFAYDKASRELEPFEETATRRVATALGLACHPKVAKQLPDGPRMRGRAETMVPVLVALEGQLDTVNELRQISAALNALASAAQDGAVDEKLVARVRAAALDATPKLAQIRDALTLHDDPFDDSDDRAKLGSRIVASVPSVDALGDVIVATERAVEGFTTMQHRALAELCDVAERVESALKLPKQPDIDDAGAESDAAVAG